MNCQHRQFTVTAKNQKNQLINFKPKCHCWACDHCRPELAKHHTARAEKLFAGPVWHLELAQAEWDKHYMRTYRAAQGAPYMRITVAGTCHLFSTSELPGSTKHAPDAALRIAQSKLLEVKCGGAHVSYSKAWLERPDEKPISAWSKVALGIRRNVFDAVANACGASVLAFADCSFVAMCKTSAADLLDAMKHFRQFCKRLSLKDPAAGLPTNAYNSHPRPPSGHHWEGPVLPLVNPS